MVERLRLAVVGAGGMGRKHAQLVAADPGFELTTLVDPVPSALATELGVAQVETLEAWPSTDQLDGVIIATPNALHLPLGRWCAERGLPMLVEKPIADSVEAAQALIDVAEARGVPVLVGHHRRHNPIVRTARELVQGGALGRLVAVAAIWTVCKPAGYHDVAWRTRTGGGPVLINLIHDIDNLRHICGEIATVQATTSNRVRGFEVEDSGAVLLGFANGAVGTIVFSDATPTPWSWELTSGENPDYPEPGGQNCYLLSGTEGALAVPSLERWHYAPGVGPSWFEPLAHATTPIEPDEPLAAQLRHFGAVIRGDEPPKIDGRDAARTLAVTLAVRTAAATGRRVSLT